MKTSTLKTNLGFLEVTGSEKGLRKIRFMKTGKPSTKPSRIALKIKNFLDGGEVEFNEVEIDMEEYTSFQKKVWALMKKIPYGQVRTYGWLAKKMKTSPRAIGQACKSNPVPIVIPCHRVVSEKGLGGYSQGIDIKKKLLESESSS